jgi:hypothetical protein
MRTLIEHHRCYSCLGTVTCIFGHYALRGSGLVEVFTNRVDIALYLAKKTLKRVKVMAVESDGQDQQGSSQQLKINA